MRVEPTVSCVVASLRFGVKSQKTVRTPPEGTGALSCFCLTSGAILPYTYGNSVRLVRLETVASPLSRRAVPNRLLYHRGSRRLNHVGYRAKNRSRARRPCGRLLERGSGTWQ